MGTRHRQAVINKAGELKIQQYGQWDGYPNGQGKNILAYLRNGNLDKYQEELDKVNLITEEQSKNVEGDENWKRNKPMRILILCGKELCNLGEKSMKPVIRLTNG